MLFIGSPEGASYYIGLGEDRETVDELHHQIEEDERGELGDGDVYESLEGIRAVYVCGVVVAPGVSA